MVLVADRDIPEEMVEKATFWNERVGRVEPLREGQPLRWWYGPLKASSDPDQKWCHDCYGVVEEGNGRRWCRLCKASQPLLDDVIEAGADVATRELAPIWVRYPVGIRSVPDLRTLIGLALSAALAGRTVLHSECDAIVPKAPPEDWTPSPCGAEMQWFGCCDIGHDQRQTLPFDARDRIERVLRLEGVSSRSAEGAAHRIMRALTEPAAGSGVGDQHE